MPVVEIQAIMNLFNKGTDRVRLVDYNAWVRSLKLPLTGRRLQIVKLACDTLCQGADSFKLSVAKERFGFDVFSKWCEVMGVPEDDNCEVTSEQFCDFYADVSMTVFEDAAFLKLIGDSWKVEEPTHLAVHQKEVELLVAALRK